MTPILYVFNRKNGSFLRYFCPPQGGSDTGLRGPWKRGSRPPKTHKISDFMTFLAFLAKKGLRKPDFRDFWPLRPPQNAFLTNFCSKPWVPPWEIEKIEKKVPNSAWNFPKLSKSYKKRGHFWPILGLGGFYHILGDKWPIFACQYPQPPAYFGPCYVYVVLCFCYKERVTTHKTSMNQLYTSQFQGKIGRK